LIEETEEYKKHKKNRIEKLKSVKKGENVFHLSYFDGIIDADDLVEYDKIISEIGFEFSSYDQNGDMHNSLDSFILDTYFILSQITITSIITNSINSATWDAIKFLVLKLWKRLRNQEITKYSSKTFKKKKIKFGIKVSLDENTHFDFDLKGDLNDDLILQSLDKMNDFIKNHKKNDKYKHPYFVEYDKRKGKWKSIDVEKEMCKIAQKSGSIKK